MTTPPRPLPQLEVARERAIQALCAHFAHDRLTTEQVDERLERAQKARSLAELDVLLADLPALHLERIGEPARTHAVAPPAEPPEASRRILAFMAEVKRTGVWAPPRELRASAIMGSVTLDLRDAKLSPGVTEIRVFALMGEVKIIVPPGVRVESTAMAILASVSDDIYEPAGDARDAPIIRLTGSAIMAEVKTRLRMPRQRLDD